MQRVQQVGHQHIRPRSFVVQPLHDMPRLDGRTVELLIAYHLRVRVVGDEPVADLPITHRRFPDSGEIEEVAILH